MKLDHHKEWLSLPNPSGVNERAVETRETHGGVGKEPLPPPFVEGRVNWRYLEKVKEASIRCLDPSSYASLIQELGQLQHIVGHDLNSGGIAKHFGLHERGKRALEVSLTGVKPVIRNLEAHVTKPNDERSRYGNHKSCKEIEGARAFIRKLIEAEVNTGRLLLMHRDTFLKLSPSQLQPIGIVDKDNKLRQIVDATFCRSNEDMIASINEDTDTSEFPDIYYATAFMRLLINIYNLRIDHPTENIIMGKMDIRSAFKLVDVDRDSCPLFAFAPFDDEKEVVAVPNSLIFGWKGSPAFFCLFSELCTSLHNAQNEKDESWDETEVPDSEIIKFADDFHASRQDRCFEAKKDSQNPGQSKRDGLNGAPAIPYMDDFMVLAVLKEQGRGLSIPERAMKILFWSTLQVFRGRDDGDTTERVSPISVEKYKKEGELNDRLEVLGAMIDSWRGVVYMSKKKRIKILRLIRDCYRGEGMVRARWRPLKALQHLVGVIQSQALTTTNGIFFLHRLYDCLSGSSVNQKGHALLSAGFFTELETWRFLIESENEGKISALVPRDPTTTGFADANRSGLGVVFFREGKETLLIRLELPEEVISRFDNNEVSINSLEAAAAVMGLLVLRETLEKGAFDAEVIRMRGDSTSATSWLSRCGTKGEVGGMVIRLLSELHRDGNAHITYLWREGIRNELADALSRIQDGSVNDGKISCDPNMSDSELTSFCASNYSHIYPQFNLENAVVVQPSPSIVSSIVSALMTPVSPPLEWPKDWVDSHYLVMSNYKLSTKRRKSYQNTESAHA